MPVEPFEILKLILGLFIIIAPGFLWSFIFSKKLSHFERIIFGFISGLGLLTCLTFLLNIFFSVKITQSLIFIIYAIYAIPIFIIYGLSVYKYGFPKISFKPTNIKYVWLLAILIFVFFMMFLPHLANNYYLPFHVDEWIHWSYTDSVMISGQSTFVSPYTGTGQVIDPEIGFHIATSSIHWMTGANLLTIFVFMPAIIGVFISMTVFNIGERSKRKFGLEAAFFIAFIPTTCRHLGPSFYVAVSMGLLILVYVIWLAQLKKTQGALFISAFVFFMFIVHPVTAFAGSIILLIYSVLLVFDKKYYIAFLTVLFSVLPVLVIYYLSTRWEVVMQMFIDSLSGKEYMQNLPAIWIDFEYLGVLIWVLFVIGTYFCFIRGGSLKRTLSLSAIAFILIIGLYFQFNYGLPIIYDRAFMYLYVLAAIVAGIGLSEIRRIVYELRTSKKYKHYFKRVKNIEVIAPLLICIIIILIAVPAHSNIGYYQMIDEEEYEAFVWIDENIQDYIDMNSSYTKGAVHPYKASPFAAVTGMYIVSSSMHPKLYETLWLDMYNFVEKNCSNTAFLDNHKISVVYGNCNNNDNLTMVYPGVYVYNKVVIDGISVVIDT